MQLKTFLLVAAALFIGTLAAPVEDLACISERSPEANVEARQGACCC